MIPKPQFNRLLIKGAALLILASLYSLTQEPGLDQKEAQVLIGEFKFTSTPLFELTKTPATSIRRVHPQYIGISAWISSVGAAVSFTDLDGNGLCNDIIHVDPRFDKVLISSAPGTPAGYQPFVLQPKQLPYDTATMAPMGTLVYDFNSDALTDILVYYWGRSPIIFYQNQNGFTEQELNPTPARWFSNAATLADFDGDGYTDILITNYFPDGAKVLDYNASSADQVMQHSMSRAYNGGNDHFFLFSSLHGNTATYTEHTEWRNSLEHPQDWTLAVGAADINGDQLPEVYFANDFGPDVLLHNLSTPGRLHFKLLKGERRFTNIRSSVLGRDSFKGMGVAFGDINGDGLLDIYVSNIAAQFALEESHFLFINTGEFDKMAKGIAPFVNRSEELGLSRSSWGWEAKLADFNNDGTQEAVQATGFIKGQVNKWAELQELAIGNDELLSNTSVWPHFTHGTELSGHDHNPFFVKSSNGRYYDIAPQIGLGHATVSRGIALSDVDHDGDLDFAVANQWEPSIFYSNNYLGGNTFLGLQILQPLVGTNSNQVGKNQNLRPSARYAVGATATVTLPNGKVLTSFVDGGNGHSGKNSGEVFFGLGALPTSEKIKVNIQWRSQNGSLRKKTYELTNGWQTILLPE